MQRRQLLQWVAAGAVASTLAGCSAAGSTERSLTNPQRKGRIRHSVARWTYADLTLPELCELAVKLGIEAIDLVGPADWPILKQYGLSCSMCNGAELNLTDGWCDSAFHPALIKRYLQHIDLVADAGYHNLICFAGNARGMDKQQALEHAVTGLMQILPKAAARGVVLQMELFNSKIDHPDYLADSSAFGIRLCERLNSPHFKLLFDIYHMQIMEGDIIRSIREHGQYFGHYHTAGVPGRHEINDSQELYYPAIARAIADSGFTGYLGQEFIPTAKDKMGRAAALAEAIAICDV